MLPLPLGSRRAPSGGKAAALSRQLWGLYCSLQTNLPPAQTREQAALVELCRAFWGTLTSFCRLGCPVWMV